MHGVICTHVQVQWQWRTVARYAMHLSWELSSFRHLLCSDGAGWMSLVGSVSSPCPCTEHMRRTAVLLVVPTGGSVARAGCFSVHTFVTGGCNVHLQFVICGE